MTNRGGSAGNSQNLPASRVTLCRHCNRSIIDVDGLWVDPEATGDDSIWREVCDRHDTFTAEHEPRQGVGA